MKFRRKSAVSQSEVEAAGTAEETGSQEQPRVGPFDSADAPEGIDRVDLGSLRLPPMADREVRLQVDEQSGDVQAVMIVGSEGALEVRAFAAPRHGDLWSDIRPRIAEETQKAGGKVAQREGIYGIELLCQRPATSPEGEEGVAPSRVIGVNGDRWMLRATYLGRPAMEPDSPDWDEILASLVVHRGSEAMAAGQALPLHLPPQARKVE